MAQQMVWRPLSGEGNIADGIRYQANGKIIGVLVEDDYCHEELPDSIRLCELVPADAPDALTVVMTPERIEALEILINVATALPHIAVPARQRNNAAKLLQTMIDELEATE